MLYNPASNVYVQVTLPYEEFNSVPFLYKDRFNCDGPVQVNVVSVGYVIFHPAEDVRDREQDVFLLMIKVWLTVLDEQLVFGVVLQTTLYVFTANTSEQFVYPVPDAFNSPSIQILTVKEDMEELHSRVTFVGQVLFQDGLAVRLITYVLFWETFKMLNTEDAEQF